MVLTKKKLNEEPEKVDSTPEEVLLRRAKYYSKINNYMKFYENYRKLSEDSKNSKEVLLQKLKVAKYSRNYGGALDSIDKLISLSNDDIELYEEKISILEKFNDYEEIRKVYDEMSKIFPNREIKSIKSRHKIPRKKYRKKFNAY